MTVVHLHFTKDKHPHLSLIDGLRSVGIIMIIWYHLWLQSWLSSDVSVMGKSIHFDLIPSVGFVGVEILLFISGFGLFFPYVLYMLSGAEKPTLRSFISHRIVRIVPSYYLAVILGFLFFTAEKASFSQNSLWHLFSHLSFIHIFFPETNGSISTVFWTIGTEVQFYLVFPLIAWCATKKPWITFAIMIISAYIFRYMALTNYPLQIEFMLRQMPAFLDIYACGMMTAYLFVWIHKEYKKTVLNTSFSTLISFALIIFFVSTLQLLSFANMQNGRFIFLSYKRLLLGVLLGAFIISLSFSHRFLQWFFNNKLVIFISVISYNLYLWHYLIILEIKSRNIIPAVTANSIEDPHWRVVYFFVSLLASILVATVVTFVFERPIVKYLLKRSEKI